MTRKVLTLFCWDCGSDIFTDGDDWIVNRDGQDVGLCRDCVQRYRREGSGPVRIGDTIPKVLEAIKGYMNRQKGKRSTGRGLFTRPRKRVQ